MERPLRALQNPEERGTRRWLLRGLKAFVSGALMVWLLSRVETNELTRVIASASLPLVGLAWLLNFVGHALSVTRWRGLLKAQGTMASYPFLFQSYICGIFFNNFLPSTIGGDGLRMYDSWRAGGSKTNAVTVIFVDRLLGALALVIYALLSLALFHRLPADVPAMSGWIAAIGMLVLAGTWLTLLAPDRIATWIQRLTPRILSSIARVVVRIAEALKVFQTQKKALAAALLLSLLLQANVILHYFVISLALGLEVPLGALFLFLPLSLLIMMLPISINAIGIRENLFAFFLAMYGVSTAEALAFAWIAWGLVLLQGMVGGIVYACRKEGALPAQNGVKSRASAGV